MALDELNIWNIEVASGGWFGEKLDKNVNLFNSIFIMIKFIYFCCSGFEIICVCIVLELFEDTWEQEFG